MGAYLNLESALGVRLEVKMSEICLLMHEVLIVLVGKVPVKLQNLQLPLAIFSYNLHF